MIPEKTSGYRNHISCQSMQCTLTRGDGSKTGQHAVVVLRGVSLSSNDLPISLKALRCFSCIRSCPNLTGSDLSAESLLSAINKCYARVLPNRESLELLMVPDADVVAAVAAVSLPSTTAVTNQASSSSSSATTATSSGAHRSSQGLISATVSSNVPASTSSRGAAVEVAPQAGSSPWQQFKDTYWTPGRLTFWGLVAAFR